MYIYIHTLLLHPIKFPYTAPINLRNFCLVPCILSLLMLRLVCLSFFEVRCRSTWKATLQSEATCPLSPQMVQTTPHTPTLGLELLLPRGEHSTSS